MERWLKGVKRVATSSNDAERSKAVGAENSAITDPDDDATTSSSTVSKTKKGMSFFFVSICDVEGVKCLSCTPSRPYAWWCGAETTKKSPEGEVGGSAMLCSQTTGRTTGRTTMIACRARPDGTGVLTARDMPHGRLLKPGAVSGAGSSPAPREVAEDGAPSPTPKRARYHGSVSWTLDAGRGCGWESLMKSVTLGNVTMSHRTRGPPNAVSLPLNYDRSAAREH
ncbi:hypothetical protein EVAR_66606_1 [Eumeta japonica]|uniref:Uncharacterized protein n=1 Tax=Eumeta variegata TaxID=151549 RepID=A0A4C2A5J4_EUMVA|nr:hypothetical protein EVAR_66606_1 [Eumeta japonica]